MPATNNFFRFLREDHGRPPDAQPVHWQSCELDGTLVVNNLAEADQLFSDCQGVQDRLHSAGRRDGNRARREVPGRTPARAAIAQDMVTQVLLGEPQSRSPIAGTPSATRSRRRSASCRASPACSPRRRSRELVDRELKELGRVMHALHAAFNNADTLEISDSVELRLLPWLRQQRAFLENCLATGENPSPLKTNYGPPPPQFLSTRAALRTRRPGELLVILYDDLGRRAPSIAESAARRRPLARPSARRGPARHRALHQPHHRAQFMRSCDRNTTP